MAGRGARRHDQTTTRQQMFDVVQAPNMRVWKKQVVRATPLTLLIFARPSYQIITDIGGLQRGRGTQHRRSMIFVRLCRDIAGCKHCWTPRDIYVGICWTNSGSRWWSECVINIGRVVISILVNFVTSSLVKVGGSLRWSSWDIYVGRSGDFYFRHK